MLKTSLPTVLLRGNILFPNNEIKLEFDNELSKNIISEAEFFHDNTILVSCTINRLEEVPQKKDLSNVGVISKIIHKIDLPNGKTRVIIKGVSRAYIHEYLNFDNENEILETIISKVSKTQVSAREEEILVKKLRRELEEYVHELPYISNSFLTDIEGINSLEEMTDLIVPNLSLSNDRLLEYLKEFNSTRRFEMVLEDLYREKEKFDIEKDIDSKVRRGIEDSQKEYLLREKIQVLKKELNDTSLFADDIDILRKSVDDLNAPNTIKNNILEEIKRYENMTSSFESSILRNYIDYLLKLPWNNKSKDNDNLDKVLFCLNEKHYGIDEAKERIIEFLAVKKISKNIKTPVLCLIGPPGVGKTTLAYNISKAIGRKFVKISLGGINDPAEIIGHRKTYLGAEPGRIIQGLRKCGTSNPVFLIDEIDKMGKDLRGDPANALLEVLDPHENKHFSDHYIEEEVDLSDCLFIATANDIDSIPYILRDRLEIIKLDGYTETEKIQICKRHIIPRICKEYQINSEYICFHDDAIKDIINYYTKEAGVRELERKISKIIRKIVKTIVLNNIKIGSIKITSDNLEKYLGVKNKILYYNGKNRIGVTNSLAVTLNGGEVFPVEVIYFKGNGKLVLTGNVGNEIRESALVCLDYIRCNSEKLKINIDDLNNNDIHIHIPNGNIFKDGTSIGTSIMTAIISAFRKQPIPDDIAYTGEVTLLGNILQVGNLKEKLEGAIRNGIKKVFIPNTNEYELSKFDNEILDNIEVISVQNYEEILEYLAKKNK